MNTIQIGNISKLDALLEFYFAHEKQLMEKSYEGSPVLYGEKSRLK